MFITFFISITLISKINFLNMARSDDVTQALIIEGYQEGNSCQLHSAASLFYSNAVGMLTAQCF